MNTGRRLLVLVFLGIGEVEAQTGGSILGQVVDQATMKPLPGANVVVKDTRYGAPADSNGYFEIKDIPPGTYAVEFRHVGYKTKYRIVNVTAGSRVELMVGLEEEPIKLPEVTVTDTARLDRLRHLYPESTFLTRAMLLETKATRLTEALQVLVPKIDLAMQRQAARLRPSRGGRLPDLVRNVLIIIDERRIHPSGEDISGNPYWLDHYVDLDEVETMTIHEGNSAWIRAGRRGERLDLLIEITRRKRN